MTGTEAGFSDVCSSLSWWHPLCLNAVEWTVITANESELLEDDDLCHSGQGFSLDGCAGGLEPGWKERSGDGTGKPDSLLKISSTLLLLVSLFNV